MEIVQVTHQEDHTAEFSVKVDQATLRNALQKAAKKVSKNYRLPGFRPGKAPYNIVETLVGRDVLIGEVLDEIGDDLYRFGLEHGEIEPYTMGEVKDINAENEELLVTFIVPKRPLVELGDYREIRVEFEAEPVEEKAVERGVEIIYQNLALTEGVDRAAEFGDGVVLTIHGFFANEDAEDAPAEAEEAEAKDPHADEREVYMHEHNFAAVLFDNSEFDAVMPGFSAEIVGLKAGDSKSFQLTFGDADDIHENLRGKTIDFDIEVEKVNARIPLPNKDDFFATLATDGQFNTVEELTAEVRKELEDNAKESAEDAYLDKIINKLRESSKIVYHEAMLSDYLDKALEDMDQGLRRQYNLTLDDFLRITERTKDQMREERREQAAKDMQTTLILQQVATDEDLFLTEEQLDAAIDKELVQYPAELRDMVRGFYSGDVRENFGSRIVSDRVTRRLMDIAKGLNPTKGPDPIEEAETVATTTAETGPADTEAVEDSTTSPDDASE